MKYVIIGGVAAGASAAARLRRLDEHAEIVLLERGASISYANCGLPYHIGGVIKDRARLDVAGFRRCLFGLLQGNGDAGRQGSVAGCLRHRSRSHRAGGVGRLHRTAVGDGRIGRRQDDYDLLEAGAVHEDYCGGEGVGRRKEGANFNRA